jgi:hypothetical protein
MVGMEHDPGVMVRTMDELFRKVEEYRDRKIIQVAISYLEIYNETIYDLLIEESTALELREDPEKGIVVAGLTEYKPANTVQVLQLLAKGNMNRSQSPTDANAQSSRSHAVLQIKIEQRDRTASILTNVRFAKLSLIDLAGSERASVTKNRGERLLEGANINKSLLALGNCINALGGKSKRHIPYRDSKLTRLLKDSLGGNCLTMMIANISPSRLHYEDTHNTLKYANRAKEIHVKVEQNLMNVQYHISQYTDIIAQLREEVEELKTKLTQYEHHYSGDTVMSSRRSLRSASSLNTKAPELDICYEQFTELVEERRGLCADVTSYKTVQQYQLQKTHWESLKEAFRSISHFKLVHHVIQELYDLSYMIHTADTNYQMAKHQLTHVKSKLDANCIRIEALKETLLVKDSMASSPFYAKYRSDAEDLSLLLSMETEISTAIHKAVSEWMTWQSTLTRQLLHSYISLWSFLPNSIKDTHDALSAGDLANIFSCIAISEQNQKNLPSSHENSNVSKSASISRKKRSALSSTSIEATIADDSLLHQSKAGSITTLLETGPRRLLSPQRELAVPAKRRITRSSRLSQL